MFGKINIDINKSSLMNQEDRYNATIRVNGEFFKEVGGTANVYDLLTCIKDALENDSEDFELLVEFG